MAPRRILFICTGNTCRSQIAEALVNNLLAADWQAVSAGTNPGLHISDGAQRVLAEIDIPGTGSPSQHFSDYIGEPFDLVITLSENARQQCPHWPGQKRRLHIELADPAMVRGSDEAILAAYRSVRDTIHSQILPLLRTEN